MKRISKQTALKGVLLAVLACNISWPKHVNVTNMSVVDESRRANSGGGAPAQPVDLGADEPITEAERPAPAQDTPISRVICRQRYKLVFQEVRDGEIFRTKLSASRESDGSGGVFITRPGRLSEWNADQDARNQWVAELARRIESNRAGTCPRPSAPTAQTEQVVRLEERPVTRDRDRVQDRDRENAGQSLQDDIANCVVSRTGRDLSDGARFRCNMNLLNQASRDLSRTGRGTREEREERKDTALESIRAIFNRLKTELKELALRGNEDDVDLASQRIGEVIEKLQDISELTTSERNRMINTLRGIQNGADTRRRALAYTERTSELNERFQSAYERYQRVDREVTGNTSLNAAQRQQILQQAAAPLTNLYRQHFELVSSVDAQMSPNVRSLRDLQRSGAVTSGDMQDYLSPYNTLSGSLVRMIDPAAMGFSGLSYVPRDPFFASTGATTGLSALALSGELDGTVRGAIWQHTVPGQALPYGANMGTMGINNTPSLIGIQQPAFGQQGGTTGLFTTQAGPAFQQPMLVGQQNCGFNCNRFGSTMPQVGLGTNTTVFPAQNSLILRQQSPAFVR